MSFGPSLCGTPNVPGVILIIVIVIIIVIVVVADVQWDSLFVNVQQFSFPK